MDDEPKFLDLNLLEEFTLKNFQDIQRSLNYYHDFKQFRKTTSDFQIEARRNI